MSSPFTKRATGKSRTGERMPTDTGQPSVKAIIPHYEGKGNRGKGSVSTAGESNGLCSPPDLLIKNR